MISLVMVTAVILLGPVALGCGGGAKPAASAAGKKGAASDTTKTAKATKGKGKAAKGKAAKEAEAAKAPTEKSEATAAAAAPRDTTPLAWGGDPFVRDWLMAGELRDMRLRAVTLGERPLALINDRVVTKGDTINGKRVAEITRDSVVFEFGGQRRGLKIGE